MDRIRRIEGDLDLMEGKCWSSIHSGETGTGRFYYEEINRE